MSGGKTQTYEVCMRLNYGMEFYHKKRSCDIGEDGRKNDIHDSYIKTLQDHLFDLMEDLKVNSPHRTGQCSAAHYKIDQQMTLGVRKKR